MTPPNNQLHISEKIDGYHGGPTCDLRVTAVALAFEGEGTESQITSRIVNRTIDFAPRVLRVQIDPAFQQIGIACDV